MNIPLKIYNPDGKVYELEGAFLGSWFEEDDSDGREKALREWTTWVATPAKLVGSRAVNCPVGWWHRVHALAVIVCPDSAAVLYNGRQFYANLCTEHRRWLDENPAWPGLLELDGVQ